MIAILDVQHGIQHPGIVSRGAYYQGWSEREITAEYAAHCRFALLEAGWRVYSLPTETSTYSGRHSWACDLARSNQGEQVYYLACHAESVDRDEGGAYYDARSSGGRRLATAIGRSIGALRGVGSGFARPACRTLEDARRLGLDVVEHHEHPGLHWTVNAWATIRGIWAGPSNISGVCVEPISLRVHAGEVDPIEVGQALATGLIAA